MYYTKKAKKTAFKEDPEDLQTSEDLKHFIIESQKKRRFYTKHVTIVRKAKPGVI